MYEELTLIGRDDLLLPEEEAFAEAEAVGVTSEEVVLARLLFEAAIFVIGAADDETPDPAPPDVAIVDASASVVVAASLQ